MIMANRLYTSVQTDRGRAIMFDHDVLWTAVHRSRAPSIAVFTDDGVAYFDDPKTIQAVQQLLVELHAKEK